MCDGVNRETNEEEAGALISSPSFLFPHPLLLRVSHAPPAPPSLPSGGVAARGCGERGGRCLCIAVALGVLLACEMFAYVQFGVMPSSLPRRLLRSLPSGGRSLQKLRLDARPWGTASCGRSGGGSFNKLVSPSRQADRKDPHLFLSPR